MRKNSSAPLICLVLVVSGCRAPRLNAAYVDPTRVQNALVQATVSAPEPPNGQPGAALTLSAKPAQEVLLDTEPDVARATRLLEADRRRARRSLTRQYSIERNANIDAIHQAKLAQLDRDQVQVRGKISDQIRARFDQYAAARTPLVVNLASLEAYLPFRKDSPPAIAARSQAAALRTQIVQLDADYLRDRRNIFARIRAAYDAELTRISTEIAGLRASADEDAGAAADRQLATAHAPAPKPTMERVKLGAIPASTILIPGSSPPPRAPVAPKGMPGGSNAVQRDLLDRQIVLWAKTNGYRLVASPSEGRDRTGEFISWIKDRQLGR